MAVFAIRLSRQRRDITQVEIMGKFAGAVGNYNAHLVAYPDVKWPQIAEEFVKSLGLSFNPYVTQVCFLPFFPSKKTCVVYGLRAMTTLICRFVSLQSMECTFMDS